MRLASIHWNGNRLQPFPLSPSMYNHMVYIGNIIICVPFVFTGNWFVKYWVLWLQPLHISSPSYRPSVLVCLNLSQITWDGTGCRGSRESWLRTRMSVPIYVIPFWIGMTRIVPRSPRQDWSLLYGGYLFCYKIISRLPRWQNAQDTLRVQHEHHHKSQRKETSTHLG